MRIAFFAGLMVVVLGGCATPHLQVLRYTKDEATQEQFMKDRYECLKEAQQRVSGAHVNAYGGASSSHVEVSCGVWTACMGARGYLVDPNGNLSAPLGMVVQCR